MGGITNSGATGNQSSGIFVLSGTASSSSTDVTGKEASNEAVEFSEVLDQQVAGGEVTTELDEQVDASEEQGLALAGAVEDGLEQSGNGLPTDILLSGEALPTEGVAAGGEAEGVVLTQIAANSLDFFGDGKLNDVTEEGDSVIQLSGVTGNESQGSTQDDSENGADKGDAEEILSAALEGEDNTADKVTEESEGVVDVAEVEQQADAATYASTMAAEEKKAADAQKAGLAEQSQSSSAVNAERGQSKVSELAKQAEQSALGQGTGVLADAELSAGADVDVDPEFERYLNQQRALVGRSEPVKSQAPATSFSELAGQAMQTGVDAPVGTSSWGDAMGERLVWLSGEGIQTAEIHLNPAELGPLSVKINVQQDSTQVVFTSQHAQVRDALEQQLPRLREMFEEQGLNLVDVEVSDQSLSQGSQSEGESDDDNSSGADGSGDGVDDDALVAHHVIEQKTVGLVDAYV